MEQELLLPDEVIATRIHWIRGEKVMPLLRRRLREGAVDSDLAEMYGVKTKELNLKVKRNLGRFPEDFMFRLRDEEWEALRFHFETSKGRGGRRYPPYAFTEHGVLMLSSVLNSERAIAVNIRIMRVFVRMNRILMQDRELMHRLERMEGRQEAHEEALQELFEAVKQLMEKPAEERRRLGYRGGDPV